MTDVNELTFYAVQGEPLNGATVELFDPTAGASLDADTAPSTAQNGLTPPGSASAVPSGTSLTFTGAPAAAGTVTFTVDVDDGTSQTTWTIKIVAETNDAPQILPAPGSAFYTVATGVYGYDANTAEALADAELRFTDPDSGALLLFSFNPGTVNGITPPVLAGAIILFGLVFGGILAWLRGHGHGDAGGIHDFATHEILFSTLAIILLRVKLDSQGGGEHGRG